MPEIIEQLRSVVADIENEYYAGSEVAKASLSSACHEAIGLLNAIGGLDYHEPDECGAYDDDDEEDTSMDEQEFIASGKAVNS